MPFYVDILKGSKASISAHDGSTLSIGRGTNADLRFDDASVALEHAVIEQGSGGWTLHDRASATGTFVNDERIESVRLASGDRINVGVYRLEVEILTADDPLFLHVRRIGEDADDESPSKTVHTLRAVSGDLLQMVGASRRAAPPEASDDTDSFMTMAATLLLDEGAEETRQAEVPPPAPPPAQAPPAQAPPMQAPPMQAQPVRSPEALLKPTRAREVPPVDYARAYRLERGVLRKSLFAALLSLATAGGLAALFGSGRQDVFSPGPLTAVHRSVTNNACGACHAGWRPVDAAGCQSSRCHDAIGVHQTSQVRDPSCLECHTEHRDLQALRLIPADGGCAGCHGELATREGPSRFASRITGFGEGDHPGFTPRSDPGALEFHHGWHLKLRRAGTEALTCESCHDRDEEGEIVLVAFEDHCQRCHNLAFDRRFGSQQAPHATPDEVLTYLAGFYSLRPEVLDRLSAGERGRLRGGLSRKQQLAVVAEWNTRSLLRNKCRTCHQLTGNPSRSRLADLGVVPTKLRLRWLEHATFRHAPHLELDMGCDDCHVAARSSQQASDVLLPVIDGCRDCHRPARPGESPATASLGRIDCMGCHTYHPEPRERAQHAAAEESLPSGEGV